MTHLHHRFMNIGFSQKRAVVYMYAWCGILAGAALATRFLPPRPRGHWDLSNTLFAAGSALLAVAASVYIAYLLEIIKLANPRIRRREEQARREAQRRSSLALRSLQARAVFAEPCGFPLSQALVCSPRKWSRLPASRSIPPGRGPCWSGTTAAGIGVGALLGWALGSWTLGALGGTFAGIPAGIFAVYRRYRDAF